MWFYIFEQELKRKKDYFVSFKFNVLISIANVGRRNLCTFFLVIEDLISWRKINLDFANKTFIFNFFDMFVLPTASARDAYVSLLFFGLLDNSFVFLFQFDIRKFIFYFHFSCLFLKKWIFREILLLFSFAIMNKDIR